MEYLGLLFEFIFFFIGLYVYMISRGMVKVEDESLTKQFAALKEKHGRLLRVLSLALCAVMFLNIILHINELWG